MLNNHSPCLFGKLGKPWVVGGVEPFSGNCVIDRWCFASTKMQRAPLMGALFAFSCRLGESTPRNCRQGGNFTGFAPVQSTTITNLAQNRGSIPHKGPFLFNPLLDGFLNSQIGIAVVLAGGDGPNAVKIKSDKIHLGFHLVHVQSRDTCKNGIFFIRHGNP